VWVGSTVGFTTQRPVSHLLVQYPFRKGTFSSAMHSNLTCAHAGQKNGDTVARDDNATQDA
jgi:hypothetical protein